MLKLNDLRNKLRIGVSDEHNHSELWHIFITPFKLLGVTVGALAVLFIIILTLAAYTPLLNLVPGYSGSKQREQMIRNILRVDSISQRMADIEAWSYDLSLIMEGRTPVVHDVVTADDTARVTRRETVLPNAADSLLRVQIEGGGIYGLNREVRQPEGMQAPVRGSVEARFAPREGVFGVRVATGLEQQVLAVGSGTVMVSQLAMGEGYTVEVQHPDNLVSIYRHLSQSLVTPGTRVRRGEVLGAMGQGAEMFEFEMWRNGNPVDPENWVVF
jgi:hypothetical protein